MAKMSLEKTAGGLLMEQQDLHVDQGKPKNHVQRPQEGSCYKIPICR